MILVFSGSPRKGNSEAIAKRVKQLLDAKGAPSELILLREKNVERCGGCVEYCNKNLDCFKKDDFPELRRKMLAADGFVFICPNYFKMPPGLFKDFIDRCSVFYTAKTDFSKKRAAVIVVGSDEVKGINECLDNVVNNFCKTLHMLVVYAKSFRSNSELKGNANDVFDSGLAPDLAKELEKMVARLVAVKPR